MPEYTVDATQNIDVNALTNRIFKLVCRTDFSTPGFALVKLPNKFTSVSQRRLMVDLKESLSATLIEQRGRKLGWFNMTRFDQQFTTKPHRDGAPNNSILILGYEPTKVQSQLTMVDYSKCSFDLNVSPKAFLEDFNPMYEKGNDKLAPYVTELLDFEPSEYQILFVNNSCNKMSAAPEDWQGVLHSAVVHKQENQSRVINSTCVFLMNEHESETMLPSEQAAFLEADSLVAY